MRKTGLLLIMFFVLHQSTGAQTSTTDEVLKPVYAKAAKTNKKVLLIFHASWCGWCKKMDASLADPSIKAAIDKNFEIAHLTVYESATKKSLENPGALELLTKLGGADKGLPYWFVLDANGTRLADSQLKPNENTGCPSSEAEVAYFVSVLQKTATLTPEELEKVKMRFRKNEQ